MFLLFVGFDLTQEAHAQCFFIFALLVEREVVDFIPQSIQLGGGSRFGLGSRFEKGESVFRHNVDNVAEHRLDDFLPNPSLSITPSSL